MAITKELQEAVNSNNVMRTRIILKNLLLSDMAGTQFDESIRFAKDNLFDLIDIHDGESFKDKNEWSKEYLNEQMVNIVNNFSEERILLLQSMISVLFCQNNNNLISKTYNADERKQLVEKKQLVSKGVPSGVAAFGIGAIIAGTVFKVTTITILGGVALAVSGALLLNKDHK